MQTIRRNCGNCEYFEPARYTAGIGDCFLNACTDEQQSPAIVKYDNICEYWMERSEDE